MVQHFHLNFKLIPADSACRVGRNTASGTDREQAVALNTGIPWVVVDKDFHAVIVQSTAQFSHAW